MKAIIQRVKKANVEVEGKVVGSINQGLLVLAAWENEDTSEDLDWMANKITGLRIFSDADDKMNLSLKDIKGELLLVSQFTLYANTKKGFRPSFIQSAKPDVAIPLYEQFKEKVETHLEKRVETGIFGANMQVNLTNDGPVTISIDTKNK